VFPLEEGLYAYIEKNLKYPEAAKEANIEGKIAIEFIIEKDGSITNIKVRKDIGYGCGDEVVRILKEMPKWKPAMQRGKPVRFKYGKNIRFTLQKEE
jgi:protein TonB